MAILTQPQQEKASEVSKAFSGTGKLTAQQQQAVETAKTAFAPVNINDTNKSTFVPDFNLNQPIGINTSDIKSTADAIGQTTAQTVGQYNALTPQQQTQQKTSTLDRVMGKVQAPTKTTADYFQERQQMQDAFLSSKGITQEQYDRQNEVGTQITSLNQQLREKELLEQQKELALDQAYQGRLTSVLRGEKALLARQMQLEKASISTQIAGLAAEYNLIEGKIDKAEEYFNKAIDYATVKEAQDVSDYKWALGFYADMDKSDRDYLQQQFENKLKTQADARAQKQLELDQIRELRLSSESGNIVDKVFQNDADAIYKQYVSDGDWGSAFNRLKQKYPNKTNAEIDAALGKVVSGGSNDTNLQVTIDGQTFQFPDQTSLDQYKRDSGQLPNQSFETIYTEQGLNPFYTNRNFLNNLFK